MAQQQPLNAPAAAYGSTAPSQQKMEDPIGDTSFCVQREINIIEFFGIEGANNHLIYQGGNAKGGTGGPLVMKSFEESGCMDRICCHSARKATFLVRNGPDQTRDVSWRIEKQSFISPAFFCCVPAQADIFTGGGAHIGHLMNPCACCKIQMAINDPIGNEKFTIQGSHLQAASCCPCVADFDFKVTKDGVPYGTMKKLKMNCTECIAGTTRFVVDIKGLSSEDRGNFVAAVILIDMVHFDNKSQPSEGGGGFDN